MSTRDMSKNEVEGWSSRLAEFSYTNMNNGYEHRGIIAKIKLNLEIFQSTV